MLFSKRSPERTIALNMLAELSGSAIYSLLYFIFIGRHLSTAYDLSFIVLSYAIGLSFFAAVFIPFHTYRIHILPFISIITALRKRQWRVLWHKIPAQFAGAYIGVLVFRQLNALTYMGDVTALPSTRLSDPILLALMNASAAAVLCYAFYVIRILFKQRRSTGTLFISLLIATIFLVTGKIEGLSALNPFGLWCYQWVNDVVIFQGPWHILLLTHVLLPVLLSMTAFFFVREMYGSRGSNRKRTPRAVQTS